MTVLNLVVWVHTFLIVFVLCLFLAEPQPFHENIQSNPEHDLKMRHRAYRSYFTILCLQYTYSSVLCLAKVWPIQITVLHDMAVCRLNLHQHPRQALPISTEQAQPV